MEHYLQNTTRVTNTKYSDGIIKIYFYNFTNDRILLF